MIRKLQKYCIYFLDLYRNIYLTGIAHNTYEGVKNAAN